MVARSTALRSPWVNLLTHVDAVAWLGGQVVRIDRQVADPALRVVDALDARVALEGAALVAALLLGLAWSRRRPALAFGILWFLLWLPPAGWWLPRPEPASERQLYLSLLGPSWMVGLWLSRWARKGGIRPVAVGALVVVLGSLTGLRGLVYADEVRFWQDAVAKAPANPRAHGNLGFALAARCRTGEAIAAVERALDLDPADVRAAVNLRLLREGAPLGPAEPACPPPVTPPRSPP
jgi:hypothetical protein